MEGRDLNFAPGTSQMPLVKPESAEAQPRPIAGAELKDGIRRSGNCKCQCKYSRCLKLYCGCFVSGIYCDGCNCVNCCNNANNKPALREAVKANMERNPFAFRPKFASSPHVGTIEGMLECYKYMQDAIPRTRGRTTASDSKPTFSLLR